MTLSAVAAVFLEAAAVLIVWCPVVVAAAAADDARLEKMAGLEH